MKESHTLALIVANYLSKYDKEAYKDLGFSTSSDAHKQIGRALGVNPNSIKNMRDEFDPLHDNPRVGWYQRPLRPSRAKVVESFQDLGEEELRDVVLEILTNPACLKRRLVNLVAGRMLLYQLVVFIQRLTQHIFIFQNMQQPGLFFRIQCILIHIVGFGD